MVDLDMIKRTTIVTGRWVF